MQAAWAVLGARVCAHSSPCSHMPSSHAVGTSSSSYLVISSNLSLNTIG